jgi:hypothetical protein
LAGGTHAIMTDITMTVLFGEGTSGG